MFWAVRIRRKHAIDMCGKVGVAKIAACFVRHFVTQPAANSCNRLCSNERRRERLSSLNLPLSSVSGTSIVAKYTPVRYSSNDKSPVVIVFIVTTKLSRCLGGLNVRLALGGVTDMPHFSVNETATSHTVFHSI